MASIDTKDVYWRILTLIRVNRNWLTSIDARLYWRYRQFSSIVVHFRQFSSIFFIYFWKFWKPSDIVKNSQKTSKNVLAVKKKSFLTRHVNWRQKERQNVTWRHVDGRQFAWKFFLNLRFSVSITSFMISSETDYD